MRKTLIIGASGLIGGYLYKHISLESKAFGTFQNYRLDNLIHLDITQKDAVKRTILDLKPNFVFLPAAFTNVDLCEEQKDKCWQINVKGVDNFTSALKDTNIKLIYFSTDYIFNGQNGPYNESSPPDPLSVYGKSKLEGENIIKDNLNNFLIIRTTCVYGWDVQQKNFASRLIKKLNNKEIVKVPTDQVTTPTYAGNLTRIAYRLVKEDKTGIYNVSSSSLISRFNFALLIAEVFGLDREFIRAVKTKDMGQKATRPLNGGLKTDKIKKELGIEIPSAKDELLLMKTEAG